MACKAMAIAMDPLETNFLCSEILLHKLERVNKVTFASLGVAPRIMAAKTRLEYVPVLSRGGGLKITIRCVPFKEMVNKYKFGTSNCKINKIT